jgi:hypothetical protein
MNSFTMGTEGMVRAVVTSLPERYDMSLTPTEMAPLLWALAAQAGFVEVPEDMAEEAVSLLSGIAETLGIEGV